MIYLQMLTSDAISETELRCLTDAIWPQPYAKEAFNASLSDGLDKPTGQIFLIRYVGPNSQVSRIVGITGYFDIDSHAGQAYLRWTGIIPSFRREGIFRKTMELLALQLWIINPSINRLIELVPDNEYGRTVVMPAFERTGFKVRPDLPIPAGEDDDWPVIPYAYNMF